MVFDGLQHIGVVFADFYNWLVKKIPSCFTERDLLFLEFPFFIPEFFTGKFMQWLY